jgi:hypothetical protein
MKNLIRRCIHNLQSKNITMIIDIHYYLSRLRLNLDLGFSVQNKKTELRKFTEDYAILRVVVIELSVYGSNFKY